jgi:TonB-linked SusC/RagA family outer membrane protein
MKKFLHVLLLVLLCTAFAQAQRTVNGTISDQRGEPLIGASVVLKGTTTGTVSDIDGTYSLRIPAGENQVLVFSYTGFKTTEVPVGASNVLDVSLEEGIVLETAVVTALGIQREEKALGYAIQKLEGDQIQQVVEPDPLRALQGKVAGVNIIGSSGAPGSATRITIRGNSSLLGDNQPLIVIDGIPYDNSEYRTNLGLSGGGSYSNRMADIDPNNVKSINVLRGAAAAALWGSRAANGVLMITTKTGSKNLQKGLGVSISSSVYAEEIANLPDFQNTYGTGTNFAYGQVNGSWGAPFVGTKPYARLDSIPHWYQGRLGFEDLEGVNVPYRAYPNNVRDLFQTGVTYDNSITITGGSEKSSMGATLSYLNNEGYVPNTGFDRFSMSVGGNTQLSDAFSLGANLNYTRTIQNGVQAGVGAAGSNNPSAFSRSLFLGRNWDVHGQPYQNPVDKGSEFMIARGTADNPLWSYENAGFATDVDRITAVITPRYEILSGLSLNYRLGMNAYSQRNKEFIRPGSTGPSSNPGVGEIFDHNIAYQEIESNLFLNYETKLSNLLSLNAIVGHNVNQTTIEQQAYRGINYVIFDIDDLDNTNNVVPYPLPDGIGFHRTRLMGLYGELGFSYNSWAYLNFSGRNDWSSTLPVDNRSYFYPAVSGSISVLDALEANSSVIDFLKIRAGWAEVGNATDPYLLSNVYLVNQVLVTNPAPTASFPFTPTGGMTVPALTLTDIEKDPNLKPERTREYEAGIDIRLFKGRVSLDATYYNKLSKNQIANVSVPNSNGFEQYLTNFGEVSNKGFELALGLTPIKAANGFNWTTFTTFTKNKNVVESLTEGVSEIQIEQGSSFAGGVIPVLRPGQEYGLLLGSVNLRDPQGNLLIDPSNGHLIRSPVNGIVGNPNPDFRLGFTNQIDFKGIGFRFVLDWQQGGDLYSNTVQSILGRGVTTDNEDREINLVIPGVYGDPNTGLPLLDENGNTIPNQNMVEVNEIYFGETFAINGADEWSVFDASYLKLREVALSYTLPQSILGNTPFGRVTLSVTGRNLWFYAPGFPDGVNFDPEVNQFGSTNKQGIEWAATPAVKRYGVNLNLTF